MIYFGRVLINHYFPTPFFFFFFWSYVSGKFLFLLALSASELVTGTLGLYSCIRFSSDLNILPQSTQIAVRNARPLTLYLRPKIKIYFPLSQRMEWRWPIEASTRTSFHWTSSSSLFFYGKVKWAGEQREAREKSASLEETRRARLGNFALARNTLPYENLETVRSLSFHV